MRREYHKEREFPEPRLERLPLGDVMLTSQPEKEEGLTLLVERKRQAPGSGGACSRSLRVPMIS